MQTTVESIANEWKRKRLRLGEERSPIKRMSIVAAVNELASLGSAEREAKALEFLVDVIDSALEVGDYGWCGDFLDALDVSSLRDDVALSPLVGTFIARSPLRDPRERYADRLRRVLTRRAWAPTEIAHAIDDLM